MRLLLDTHILLWAAAEPRRVPREAARLIADDANTLMFSVASIWEVAIKFGLRRPDFFTDPRIFRRRLLEASYEELPISGEHAAAVANLPTLHGDPFDRLLVAQASVEGALLVTSDARISAYPGPVRMV